MPGATIIFSNDYSIKVKESKAEIEEAIQSANNSHGLPLLHLTRERDGQELLINATQIWICLG